MQKAGALLLILFLGLPFMLFAQEDNDPSIDEWDNYTAELYTMGDQVFCISLGVGFPLGFWNNGQKADNNIDPAVGGTGMLSYHYYFNSLLFVGGDIGLLFLPTVAGNVIYLTSFGFKAGTQLVFGRFEFPVFATIGMTIQQYLDFGYFGMYLRAGASAFFRATHEWSFGLTSTWSWFPQWTDNKAKNMDGHFIDIMLTARYHF
ncbi:MAG: hypothetical protein FWB77_05170 [Treponema sp.]|nr:hypothetical protein [Treponema sp.]